MVHLLLAIIYLSFIGPYVMGYMLNGGYHWTVGYFASMFFIGITVGRAINGFLSLKLNDTQLIRLGQAINLVFFQGRKRLYEKTVVA